MVDSVVYKGFSLPQAIDDCLPDRLSAEDQRFVKALSYGTVRDYYRLDFILGHLLNKPLHKKEHFIKMLALVGLYQLASMRVAPHAAVSTTVQAAHHKPWAKSLLNAVLRNFQRQHADLERLIAQDAQARTAHPVWMIETFQHDWQSNTETLLQHNNRQAPMVLRVNRLKFNRDDYLGKLKVAGISAQPSEISVDGIVLDTPIEVASLPEFEQGAVYVQDSAAQLVAHFLDIKPGQRVADLCAAPGGKAIHALERCPQLKELVAVDIEASRVNTITSNAQRCGVSITLHCADATNLDAWWDGSVLDRVMLDVPCSGTGVIRRHPDIKCLRRAEDIPALVKRQRALLVAGWKILSPGGVLLYSTCSVLKQENTRQIKWFLKTHADAREWPIELPGSINDAQSETPGRQVLTGTQGMDGFYYARLRKTK